MFSEKKEEVKKRRGSGRVPPHNQGLVTAAYNQHEHGENPAKTGVGLFDQLGVFTQQAVFNLRNDYQVFAGQRDDGFYADIQSIFDLDFNFSGSNKPFDSQEGGIICMLLF